MLGSFNGSMTWADALKQTAYTAELERKTAHGAGSEEHLLARLQRDHAVTHAELQASRRCAERLDPSCLCMQGEPDSLLNCSAASSCTARGKHGTGHDTGDEKNLLACLSQEHAPTHAGHQQ